MATIQTCDLCGSTVEKFLGVTIGYFSPRVQFCADCGKPVIKFLEDKHLLHEALVKDGLLAEEKGVA